MSCLIVTPNEFKSYENHGMVRGASDSNPIASPELLSSNPIVYPEVLVDPVELDNMSSVDGGLNCFLDFELDEDEAWYTSNFPSSYVANQVGNEPACSSYWDGEF